jgi:hypothetical protein
MVQRGLLALLFILLLPMAARSGDPEWGTSDPAATGPTPRCVIFYEGKNCDPTQGRSSCCTESGPEMSGCWTNDEARSMKIYGGPDTTITAFDDPQGGTHDDYFVLQKQDLRPVCVGSFDEPDSRAHPPQKSTWFYSGGDGLDGKVSTFRWTDPREPEGKAEPATASGKTPPAKNRERGGSVALK